jgi:cobalt-zinc-cadmium efflux system outer membrane protein
MTTLARYMLMLAVVWPFGTRVVEAQAPVPASPPVVAPGGLSIEALVRIALERAPGLEAADQRIQVADGDRTQASLRPNPVVATDRREQAGGPGSQTAVTVTVPLDLFRKGARVAVADHDVRRAEWMAAQARVDRAALVRMRAADLLAATRELGVIREIAVAGRTRFDLLSARVEAGAAMPLERDVANVEWQRAETAAERGQGEVAAAMAALKAVAGWPQHEPLQLAATLDEAIAALPAAPASPTAVAVAARPDVLAAEAMTGRAEARQQLARQEGRFDLGISGGYMTRVEGGMRMHDVMVGVMVDLPWRNRQQGAIAAATADGRVARAEVAEARLQAESEMASALARDVAATAAVARYRAGLVELAARNLDVVREMWTLGRGTVFDVIEEERRYLDLQSAYTAALRELVEARATVLRAWGVQS